MTLRPNDYDKNGDIIPDSVREEMTYEQALQTIWDRCQHCEETEKAFKVLRGDNK